MSGSLESPEAKVRRAVEHYRIIKGDFLGGLDRKLRPVTPERHREGLEYRFRIGNIEPVDPRFALVLGDGFCIFDPPWITWPSSCTSIDSGERSPAALERASNSLLAKTLGGKKERGASSEPMSGPILNGWRRKCGQRLRSCSRTTDGTTTTCTRDPLSASCAKRFMRSIGSISVTSTGKSTS